MRIPGRERDVLGVIAGMMPLLVIFQIPPRVTSIASATARFVLGGWSTGWRSSCHCPRAAAWVVLLTPTTSQPAVAFVFCFNLSRGISSCAWLPWITLLVPGDLRGRYLAATPRCKTSPAL